MIKKLILTYTYNRRLGAILQPAIAVKEDKSEFYQTFPVLPGTPGEEIPEYSDGISSLINLTFNYTEKNIFDKYGRAKQSQTDFYQQVNKKLFEDHIRPFIDKKIVEVLQAAKRLNIPVYQKKSHNVFEIDRLEITDTPLTCNFHFAYNGDKLNYNLKLTYQNTKVDLMNQHVYILCEYPSVFILNKKIYFIEDFNTKKIIPFIKKHNIEVPNRLVDNYLSSFTRNMIKSHNVTAEGFEINEPVPQKEASLTLEPSISFNLALVLGFQYDHISVRPDQSPNKNLVEYHPKNKSFVKIVRDQQWEHEKKELIKKLGLIKRAGNTYTLKKQTDDFSLVSWINQSHNVLTQNGFRIINHTNENYHLNNIQLIFDTKDKNDWFDLYGLVKLGEFEIPFIKLRKNIIQGIREFTLPDSSIAIIPEAWFADYKELFGLAEKNGETLRLQKYQFQVLNQLSDKLAEQTQERLKKLYRQTETYTIPGEIQATLRSYQSEGYNWMRHLRENKFGGCLADDMGLGKTLQTLTLLTHHHKHGKTGAQRQANSKKNSLEQLDLFANQLNDLETKATSLIIAPASLIHNWQNEIEKFAPALKVTTHTGTSRTSNINNFNYSDIVLTSYGIVRNDIELLKGFLFDYIVIDESQHIKNPGSAIYKSVNQLRSEHKMVLTGTPIENSLTDLWAQLNFINPGIVGTRKWFNDYYVTPVEKKQDQSRLEKLKKVTAPFVLRRTKNEVAKDLPELAEQTILCEMSAPQEQLYEETKSSVRNALLNIIKNDERNKNATLILKALNELRQLANNPELLDQEYSGGSGKTEIIEKHIENLIAENHKVLIFSSFVKHLKIIEDICTLNNWKYSLLTGQTRNREEVINEFQDDESNHLFLISLKAGGVGLNLTAADYVMMLDPWWNPAAEAQAINRAHRIGQTKNVMVYRYITRNTIEEKMRNLQNKKQKISDELINDNIALKNMTNHEIEELFK